ncbi:MAG TPA: sodium:calcium antiporter [Nitrospirae bacterium]|nr:sodium:calcium antiporter [Nitrospirota bacterium]
MFLWTGFVLCTLLIVYSGSKLSKYGDVIAEKTGLSRTWVGLVLLASVTSLPELVTGITSVTYTGTPDIAVGDILGSCVFNMLILAMLDAAYRPLPISTKAHQGHILSAGFGLLLISIVAMSIFAGTAIDPIGWIGPYTLLIIVIYFIAMRTVFYYEKRKIAAFIKETVQLRYEDISTRTAIIHYSINAMAVIIAAVFLPEIGKGIAETTGLGQTFTGNIFIAISTSLPEVVVSLAALRIDAVDLAIGNLFGSNIFNIFILAIDDIFFTKGPILSFTNTNHIISALSAITMITIAIIGLTYRSTKKPLFLAWDSLGILLVYIINLMLLYASI